MWSGRSLVQTYLPKASNVVWEVTGASYLPKASNVVWEITGASLLVQAQENRANFYSEEVASMLVYMG